MMEDFVRIDGPRINDSAVELLKMLTFFNHKLEINLVKVSGADLGFKTDAKRDHIFNQAAAFGLLTVPAQVGPELRLQIPIGMPESELCIGMDPIAVSSIAEMAIFKLGSQYLMTADGTSFRKWPPSQEWIFRASDQR